MFTKTKLKIRRIFNGSKPPSVMEIRKTNSSAAVIFLHGFSGHAVDTWRPMINHLMADRSLNGWDIYSLSYPTSLRVDVPNFWAADPGINTLALELITTLETTRFNKYRAIAIASHSMGGLVAQRAICDRPTLRNKISHLFLYGTPSLGLKKATYFGFLKRQLRDLSSESHFIKKVRADWSETIGENPTFCLRVIAGDRDEFVSGESSIRPFPELSRRVVPGDHKSLIIPTSHEDQTYDILAGSLSGQEMEQTVIDGAEVALELRQFNDVIRDLWGNRHELDENAVVTLALALEGVGKRKDAVEVLEHHYEKDSSDIIGTLAGRLKRRWLSGRVEADFFKSRQLYLQAYNMSLDNEAHHQCYYHGINIAFLDLMALHPDSEISSEIKDRANSVISHCERSPDSMWRTATMAEATLILGDLEKALQLYRTAASQARPRELQSLSSQAIIVSQRVFGKSGAKDIAELMGLKNHIGK